MRYKLLIVSAIFAFAFSACSKMYDGIEKYGNEQVYPARYDTIIGYIGFERVEIDLMKAGRINSSEIKLGKAQKTVIEYENKVITIDSLVSWVNITGLTQSKLYRFLVYTIDEFENKSVPQEIALIPYTSTDFEGLAMTAPRIMSSPSAAVIEWPNGLNSPLLDYTGLRYAYTDKEAVERTGVRETDPRFLVANVAPSQQVTVNVTYRVIPKMNNRRIIDTLELTQPLRLEMPTESTPFTPAERAILEANGVTVFTAAGVSAFDKLTFPIHTGSLADIFYFPNIKEVDLTGGTVFEMPKTTYTGNGVTSIVGGGYWLPFAKKVSNISAGNQQALKDLLELGLLDKVRYVPNSMGLDDLLAPYIATGVVELEEMPNDVLIPPSRFFLNGQVQTNDWRMDITYPATDAPNATGLNNIVKTILRSKNASFGFSLPVEYAFNVQEYRYLKFKVYMPAKSALSGTYEPYQRLWPRIMNYIWAFSGQSSFGQEYWAPNADDFRIPDADLQTWKDVTVDLNDALNRHNRVIVINIGGEPNLTFSPAADMVYYFSDFRFTKE